MNTIDRYIQAQTDSKWGGGIGGPVQVIPDPNNPSFDPAEYVGSIDKIISWSVDDSRVRFLTPWELQFMSEMYGATRRTRKQIMKVWKIYKDLERKLGMQ